MEYLECEARCSNKFRHLTANWQRMAPIRGFVRNCVENRVASHVIINETKRLIWSRKVQEVNPVTFAVPAWRVALGRN
ncbi:hypothetical protein SLH49_20610 [Cognatiyoonia sp. IB215446]|uniref:hypothetical protein n=1 Tax=Cognatiyoonia sp. IB215446 TaxID=3097355 RepID=UPI002A108B54|nr:hypothetical protein [Cognatiyoonia sp. IB215446]MDX8350398.1 hypothetical protein [Cognatiyoonia sp. IB215446]